MNTKKRTGLDDMRDSIAEIHEMLFQLVSLKDKTYETMWAARDRGDIYEYDRCERTLSSTRRLIYKYIDLEEAIKNELNDIELKGV